MEELEFKKHKRFMLLCTIVSAIVFIAGMLAVFFFGTFTTIYTTTIVSSVECDEPEWSLVADMMGCNIIEVYSSSTAGTSAGSGFIVSTDDSGRAIAITNHHVIENNYNSIYVRTIYEDVGYVVSCTLLGYDEYHDVAVLRLPDWYAEGCFIDLMDPEGEGYAKGSFFSSTTMGEAVAAIGNASGAGLGLVSGVISNSSTSLQYIESKTVGKCVPVLQTTAAINSGMSGSALMNAYGQIVGLNTYKADSVDDINYSVPIEIVLSVYDNVMAGNYNSDKSVNLFGYGDYCVCLTAGDYYDTFNVLADANSAGTSCTLMDGLGFSGLLLSGKGSESAGLVLQTDCVGLEITESKLDGLSVGDVIVSIGGVALDDTFGTIFGLMYDFDMSWVYSSDVVEIVCSNGNVIEWKNSSYSVIFS